MARKNKHSRGGASKKSTNTSRPGNGCASNSSNNNNNNNNNNSNNNSSGSSKNSSSSNDNDINNDDNNDINNGNNNSNGSGCNNSKTNIQHGGNKPASSSSPVNTNSEKRNSLTSHISASSAIASASATASAAAATASASAPASSLQSLTPTEVALAHRNLEILQGEFTTLDEALIISIHLDSPFSLSKSRAILSHLSGVTILGEDDCPPAEDEFPPESTIEYTPTTSSEQGGSGSGSGGGGSSSGDAEEEELDLSDLAKLKRVFPMVKEFTLVRALEKSPAGAEGAMDELLNRVFLDEVGEEEKTWKGVGRGVDGFGMDDDDNGEGGSLLRKKNKGKGRKVGGVGGLWIDTQRRMGFQEDNSRGVAEAGSRWNAIQRDISFLSAVMHIPQQTVASACHAAGGDIAETVYQLVDRLHPPPARGYGGMLLDTGEEGGDQEKEVLDLLSAAFPGVERGVGKGLWRLVVGREWAQGVVSPLASPVGLGQGQRPRVGGWSVTGRGHAHPPRLSAQPPLQQGDKSSLSALFTLAAILQNSPRSPSSICTPPSARTINTPLPLSPRSPPATYASRARPTPSPQLTITINSRTSTTTPTVSYYTPADSTTDSLTTLNSSLQHALSMQSAYFRRSTARNNLSSAAAYYSQHAQDLGQKLRDMQVNRVLESVKYGSEGAEVDLHGLKVVEGVRVAKEVVEGFFEGRRGRDRGTVRVITGKGRHSKDGKGVMGPAVVKMLREEGWRVQVGSGWVDVRGRNRG
ncbi:hypothetical protein L211DRAFT_528236 [Terfezia boudieri ATCC MYA-4762]|uniref:Smr domain-containing protein n=1 Tax=Terfezia boudieri ATCC MYA-4762 TaxID=1051890 RepID=A0A3N4LFW7_9PEZI|nr:hypothetical protein L211DRAFT_528236 [Terfezia boudieri ATCC MYA-4762]